MKDIIWGFRGERREERGEEREGEKERGSENAIASNEKKGK